MTTLAKYYETADGRRFDDIKTARKHAKDNNVFYVHTWDAEKWNVKRVHVYTVVNYPDTFTNTSYFK